MPFFARCSADILPRTACARVPPSAGSDSSSCYVPSPKGFEYGHWWRTYQSFGGEATQRNIEILAYPGETLNISKVDFITYQTPGCDVIYSIYGLETPTNQTDVKTYRGTGTTAGISGPLEIVAHGYDTACDAYVMYWEPGPTGAFGLTTISQSATGPSAKTLSDLLDQVKAFNISELTTQADALAWIPYDGARASVPYPACGEACLTNNNNPDASGSCPSS